MSGGIIFPSHQQELSHINNFVSYYNTTTSVLVKAGTVNANSKSYVLAADTVHSLTSLVSGLDIHYLYIDDSASSPPNAVLYDSTTEPTYSIAKGGWYNGDDRCIDVFVSPAGAATVPYFATMNRGDLIKRHYGIDILPRFSAAQTPNGSWQTPNVNPGSGILPVNAKRARIWMNGTDAFLAAVYAASEEMAAVNTTVNNGEFNIVGQVNMADTNKIILGPSRNIKVAGLAGNGAFSALHGGYDFER